MKTTVMATATITIIANSLAIADVFASTDADYTFTLASDWHNCQRIGTSYQEVYAFETDSFYINICQKDDAYFYSGEAKQSNRSSIFIPAYPLENNRGFQAKNGNVSYLVVLPFNLQDEREDNSPGKPAEAILTIKRNDRLVSVESSLNKYCHASENSLQASEDSAIAFNILESQLQDYDKLVKITPQQDFSTNLSFWQREQLLAPETFKSDSHFDFYRVGGELYRLTTCQQETGE